MPTYNDSKYIRGAVKSIINQSYKKWELIIIDGSTDNTPEIVKEFSDRRIVYLRERSVGQLNALYYGSRFVRGQYVTLLHSDDEFSNSDVFENNLAALRDSNYDGLFCDLIKMDGDGNVYGAINVVDNLSSSAPSILFLRGGSNIISDFFFVKRNTFENVLSNYITWNMPYWLKFEDNCINILNLKKVEPWYKYRVYSENYIRSHVGRFETINGCLRTVVEVSKRFDFPFLEFQTMLIRILKKWSKPLFNLRPCSPKHLRQIVQHVLNCYYDKIPENPYFKGLLGFYTNLPCKRTIKLQFENAEETFLGKDARLFFDLMDRNELPPIFEYVLEQATEGFGRVVVTNKENCKKAEDMMKFLNLSASVAIG